MSDETHRANMFLPKHLISRAEKRMEALGYKSLTNYVEGLIINDLMRLESHIRGTLEDSSQDPQLPDPASRQPHVKYDLSDNAQTKKKPPIKKNTRQIKP